MKLHQKCTAIPYKLWTAVQTDCLKMGMLHKYLCAIVFCFSLFQTSAASANVFFGGNVTTTCTVVVTRNGTLDPRGANYTRLTSRSGPGTPGRANVTTTGPGFTVSVDPPSAFNTQPAADTSPETFRAWHRSNGATVYGTTQVPMPLNTGLSRIRVHMDARKIGGSGDTFSSGNYSASVTLRCE